MANSSQTRLFVTGATGQLGRLVIRELLERIPASNIVAGVRSTDHDLAKQFAAQGVEIRVADYTQPDTLSPTFQGIDRLLLISSSAMGERGIQHRNVIAAAKAAGVALIAYTSMLHADTSPLAVGDEHRETEALLANSGLAFVLLRHGWYTENHLESIAPALQYGAVLGSAGEGRFSSATRADFAASAASAAEVLTSDSQAGRVYELAGDESYTLADLAAAIATRADKPVVYRDMPKAGFKATLIGMGLPEVLAELIADSDIGALQGGPEDNGRQLSALIGRPTTPFRQTVELAISTT